MSQLRHIDTILLPRIPVANGDGVIYKRFVIDGDAERRAILFRATEEFRL